MAVLAGTLLTGSLALAQEPPPPPPPTAAEVPAVRTAPEAPTPRRWKASAELSYTDQTGNRTLRLLTAGLRASHLQKDLFRLDASVQSRYGESDAGIIARSHQGTLAFDLRPQEVLSPFLFVEAEHDRFKRVNARFSGGAGAKYTLYRSADGVNEASVSLAMLISHENLVATPADPVPDSRTLGRGSLRVRGSRELPSGVRLHHVSFYQPAVEQMADYLLRSETGARITLVRSLALSVVYQLNRTALPPEGVVPDDRMLRTGIIFDF